MRTLSVRAALLTSVLLGATPMAAAQTELPKAMTGSWSGVGERNVPFNGTMSVAIDRQNPDGSIAGRMTVSGQLCWMRDEPMIGRFDGTVLTMEATYRPLEVPQASCGKATFVLKRSGSGFEGEVPGSRLRLKVNLAPS
jgi:hypothetical protein